MTEWWEYRREDANEAERQLQAMSDTEIDELARRHCSPFLLQVYERFGPTAPLVRPMLKKFVTKENHEDFETVSEAV